MIKKFIALLMTFSMMFSLSITYASHEQGIGFEHRLEVLRTLGIVDENITLLEDSGVTRGDFLEMICGFFTVSHSTDEERFRFAEDLHIISDADSFDADREITYEEAVKMLVCGVGFASYATGFGGYPSGYISVAHQIGLTDGISGVTGTVKAPVIVSLLYNALEIDVAKPVSYTGGIMTSEILRNEGALSIFRNIVRIEGTVTATDKTSLNGAEGVHEGFIEIDEEVYEVKGDYPDDIIGLPVMAYIYDIDEYGEVLYIETDDKEIDTTEINCEDIIEVDKDCSVISYYDNGKEKKERISPVVKVIYNDVLYDKYTASDLMPQSGSVRLVDIDDDRYADIVFVESFETMLVDGISLSSYTVSNKLRYEGAITKIELDESDDKYNFEIIKDGVRAGFTDIAKYDVLNVARSMDGTQIKIIISSAMVHGKVKSVNSSDRKAVIEVDGADKEVGISEVYYKASEVGVAGVNKLELGFTQNIYLDCFGRIVAVKNADVDNKGYVWAVKCYTTDEDEGEELWLKYLSSDDEWYVAKFVKKPVINKKKKTAEEAGKILGAGAEFENQLLKIKLNEKSEITEVSTAVETEGFIGDDVFTVSKKYTMTYRSPALYTSGNASVFYPSSGATVFLVPPSGTAFDETNYIVMTGYFSYNQNYQVRAYSLDEFRNSDIFVVETDSNRKSYATTGKYLLITDLGTKLTSDGTVANYIKGNLGNVKNIEITVAENNAGVGISELGRGDYIKFDIDRYGYATNIEKYVDFSAGAVKGEVTFNKASVNHYKVVKGIANKVSTEKSMVILDYGSNILPFKIPGACYIYDEAENTITNATAADISEGDYVAIVRDAYTLTTNTAVIYRFREVK